MIRTLRCFSAWLCALLIILLFSVTAFPVAAETDSPQRIPLATTPEEVPGTVYYYQGNYKVNASSFTWVTGRNGGDAVTLNGRDEYIRIATAQVQKLSSFTFSTWICWNGNSDAGSVDGQELLTLYRNETHYLSVIVHAQDADKKLNGLYMQWVSPDSDPVTVFTPAEENISFALPAGEWHHVAVTASDTTFSLYVDGVLQLHQTMDVDFDSFDFRTFKIGAGFDKKPYLNATLQDAYLYTEVLTDEQILLLSQDADPLSGATATTTTQPLATRPTQTSTTAVDDGNNSLQPPQHMWGLPGGMIALLGGIVLVVIVLSVIFSMQNARQQTDEEDDA